MSYPEEPKGDEQERDAAEAEASAAAPEDAAEEPEGEVLEIPEADEASLVALLQEQVGGLNERVAELEAQLEQTTAKLRTVSKAYSDLQGDYDHFRARTAQQIDVKAERKAAEAVEKFFDPVQNLKRSLEAAGELAETSFVSGLRLVLRQFDDAMKRLGLERIPGEGADFDPNLHEALGVTPVSDPAMDGKILHVHTDGYRVKSQVIQASQVIIGKYEQAPTPAENAEPDDGEEPAGAGSDEEPSNGA